MWYGWGTFQLGEFISSFSYLTDAPIDLLEAFINYHENGYGAVVFDTEGSHFTLVLTAYNWGIFVIDETEVEPKLHNFCDMGVANLENELINDLESALTGWSMFLTDDDEEEILLHQDEICQRIAKLKEIRSKSNC